MLAHVRVEGDVVAGPVRAQQEEPAGVPGDATLLYDDVHGAASREQLASPHRLRFGGRRNHQRGRDRDQRGMQPR